jgi:anti-anti-sigma factor
LRFILHEAECRPDCYVVGVEGEIDVATSAIFRGRLTRAVALGFRAIVADLTKTTFLDSWALHALIAVRLRLAPLGGRLAIAAGEPAILRVLADSAIDRVFPIAPNLAEALRALDCADELAA